MTDTIAPTRFRVIYQTMRDSDTTTRIGAVVEGYINEDESLGYIFLDQVSDLHNLRDTLDKEISIHNIPAIPASTMHPSDIVTVSPAVTPVDSPVVNMIHGFICRDFEPTDTFDSSDPGKYLILSTQDIIIEMVDMADLELNDVAAAMHQLGFHTVRYEDHVGWLLKKVIVG